MNWEVLLHIATVILGALASGIPILMKWNTARKAKNNALTEAEKEKAQNEMIEQANAFILMAEETYKSVDKIMKGQNSSAGSLKKETVMSRLQAYAISKGYVFDVEYWSKKIDEIVSFTKSVNSVK